MPDYLLVLQGVGGGCDHTIGCNINFYHLNADSAEEALEKARSYVMPDRPDEFDLCYRNDIMLGEAIVAEVVGSIDITVIYDECRRLTKERKKKDEESTERAELERLRKKYAER